MSDSTSSGSGYGSGPIPPGAVNPQVSPTRPPMRLAEWSSRVGAALIDSLIILAIFFAVLLPILGLFPALNDSVGGVIGFVLLSMGGVFVFSLALALYAPIMLVKWDGQTIGKRVCGIRVVKADGAKLDFVEAFVREALVKGLLVLLVAIFTFLLAPLINYLWPLWDAENRCLHDLLCSTRVVEA